MVDFERAAAFRKIAGDRDIAEEFAGQPGSGAADSAAGYRDYSSAAFLTRAGAKRADREQAVATVPGICGYTADEAPARAARAGIAVAAESDNRYPSGGVRAGASERDHPRAPAKGRTRVASGGGYRRGGRRDYCHCYT